MEQHQHTSDRLNQGETRNPKRLPRALSGAWMRTKSGISGWLPTQVPVAIKLAISISLVIIAAMSLLGALIVHNQTQLLNRQAQTFGSTVVEQMAESAKEPILAEDTLLLDVLAANLASGENVVGTAIYSADRKLLSHAGRYPFEPGGPYAGHEKPFLGEELQTLEWSWPGSSRGPLEAVSFVSPVRFQNTTVGYALISFSRSSMVQAVDDSVRSIVVATLLLIVLGVAISYVVGRQLTRPLDHLMNASRAIDSGFYNFRLEERRNDEIGYLMQAFNSMAQGLLRKAQVEEAFSRYVPPGVARNVLDNLEEVELGGKEIQGSVMFVDIVGFTARSETMDPERVAELLNNFYDSISRAAARYNGTIDKYMGDCAMLVFGIPESDDQHVFHSIACAVFFQRLAERINDVRISQGKFPVYYRIGLNSGAMLAGNMGSSDRVQFTVVGDSVNLASRLCSVATTGQIVITEEIYKIPEVRRNIIASQHDSIRIRGKSQPVSTYLVHDLSASHQENMERHVKEILRLN